ncbi:ESX secretion-associated protein EspG [Actinokineospora guangxiensis]|uniref:ESX secretion-associated protein EspG n=1 Tax=Actinokineospora guangxiensis TaxID=1490288 RepID=A0ABW0EE97_9PSEU
MTSAAHRLVLTAAEYAHVVGEMGLSMPPDWAPAPDIATGAEAAALAEREVVVDGRVHPSVQANLRVLSGPQIMFDTTATIGARGSRSLHAIAGQYGASLFLLPDAAVELSMFRATDLGRELVRAVPAEAPGGIGSALDGDDAEPLRGRVPLAALHELGVAELLRESDPDVTGHVLGELRLPPDEAAFAVEAVRRADGVLRCLVVALIGEGVRTAQLSWLHSDTGWVGIRPAPTGADRQLVDLEPVAREDIGVWLAPFVSEALS